MQGSVILFVFGENFVPNVKIIADMEYLHFAKQYCKVIVKCIYFSIILK